MIVMEVERVIVVEVVKVMLMEVVRVHACLISFFSK